MFKEFGFFEKSLDKKVDNLAKLLRQIIVGSDIDNTEVATSANGILIVNRTYGTHFQLSDLKYDFAIVDLLANSRPDLSDPKAIATGIWNSDENIHEAMPTPGALIVSSYLDRMGVNKIHRITSRPSTLRRQTKAWYEEKMPWVDRSLIHIQTSGNEVNKHFKVAEAKRLGVNLFLEDVPLHAELIAKETGAVVAIIPQSFNQSYEPEIGTNIIVVPERFYPNQPAYARMFLYLAKIYG